MTATLKYDAIVIGGGVDGMVAATMLAKSGRDVLHLVREQSDGGRQSIDLSPGFRFPITLEADWIPPSVLHAMGPSTLRGTGLSGFERAVPRVPLSVALPDGGFLSLPSRVADAVGEIRAHSPHDADRWGQFTQTMRALAGFLEALYQVPPPDLDSTSLGDLPSMLGLGRSFRSLGKANMSELLRVMPMPVQDLADDWFTFEPLKAALGSAAVRDIRQGPRSGGTSFVLLHYLVGAAEGCIRGRPQEGSPFNSQLLLELNHAAVKHSVRTRTGVGVAQVLVQDEAVTGVVLEHGEEILAPCVVTTEDPATTFLRRVDPVWLDPEFLLAVKNIKFRGCTAMVYYTLDGLPDVPGLADPANALAGVISLSSSLDAIEKAYDAAKYGAVSEAPHIEISVPSLRWPDLAPQGKHVLAAKVQYAPHTLRDGDWDDQRARALGETVTASIARAIPRFTDVVRDRLVVTPRDIATHFGAPEGALTHGEITLDQILFMRPVAGWGQYATPLRGLYLAGPGTHPGPGILGVSGLMAAKRVLADGRQRR